MKPIKHLVFFFLLISYSQHQYNIAFVSNRNGNLDIYLTNIDTAKFVKTNRQKAREADSGSGTTLLDYQGTSCPVRSRIGRGTPQRSSKP